MMNYLEVILQTMTLFSTQNTRSSEYVQDWQGVIYQATRKISQPAFTLAGRLGSALQLPRHEHEAPKPRDCQLRVDCDDAIQLTHSQMRLAKLSYSSILDCDVRCECLQLASFEHCTGE